MKLPLRLVLVLVLLVFSIVPALGTVVLTLSAKQQDSEISLDGRLAEISRTGALELKNDLERFRQILLTSAQNPAYVEIMLDPQRRDVWKHEVDQSLLNLTTVFPGMIDEACRIDLTGVELGRVVQGQIAPNSQLSSQESKSPFFQPTAQLVKDGVHFQSPYLSPDTNRWVISASTPLFNDGQNYGILHFEVPLAYYYRTLKSVLPADGQLALIGSDGLVYVNSAGTEPGNERFRSIRSLFPDDDAQQAIPAILAGKAGFTTWKQGDKSQRFHYETIELAPGMSMALLVGLPAVPGPLAQMGSVLLPFLLGVLGLLVLAVVATTLLVRPMQISGAMVALNAMGMTRTISGEKDAGSEKRGQGHGWLVLAVAIIVAGSTTYIINELHSNVRKNQQVEVSLVRMDGLSRWLNAVQPGTSEQITPEHISQVAGINDQLTQTVNELAVVDGKGSASQQVSDALRQYSADIAELHRLFNAGRNTEASTWNKERVSQSFGALLNIISDNKSVYTEAALRADTTANVGSGVALVLAAMLISLLFWRFEQLRRNANMAAEEALRHSEKRFRSLVQNSSDVITVVGTDATIQYQSVSIERIFGYEPGALAGTSLIDLVHPEDAPTLVACLHEMATNSAAVPTINYRLKHSDGSWRYAETTMNSLLSDPDVHGVVLNTRDVSERKALEDELAYRAFHDSLTSLANRALFMDRLAHALAHPPPRTDSIAVLFLDLDGFKQVNDSLGHEAGDQLLIEVGRRLQTCLRPADTVARLGGDEFTVLLEDITDMQQTIGVVERITEELQEPFYIHGNQVFISSSIGVTSGTSSQDHPDLLLRYADAAMYEAKSAGKARYVIFNPEMRSKMPDHSQLEMELRQAIKRNAFKLFYQPVLDLHESKMIEVEALLRWEHPTRGLLAPAEFIGQAEESGLIVPMGQWVLKEACRQARAWQKEQGTSPALSVSVNLSARQVAHPTIVKDVQQALIDSGLAPQFLKLEITERVAMEETPDTVKTLHDLKQLGVRLAIDDFGTGYSTLSYLKLYPVDTLKLDRSFVHGLEQGVSGIALVRAMLAFAEALNLTVTAEGIETAEQFDCLRGLGCNSGQGYHFSRPVPAEVVSAFLVNALSNNGNNGRRTVLIPAQGLV